ncbi:RIP metalloprotease RseP [Roseovarius aestuariivivens]|uniref:RIP metalloprotease RseP n=1 Tax=Roseovarius aestuariivivens TaxID=1888910 RepID=UPI0010805199|nr:RIP metalloprotease RseP [Roseovarius aestuariivivens]
MTLLAFVAALSVIVAIHEYGHYIVGRWCGIKADVFSLGFGPVIYSRVDRHGTRWQLAALPFGGYVKFMGDANAASGTSDGTVETMPPEERRKTMLGAPLWARTLTVAAGPVFNFALSILVFAAVIMAQGKVAEPLRVGELRPLPVSEEITLQEGDELISIEGVPMPDWSSEENDLFETFVEALPQEEILDYEVRRDGEVREVRGPHPMPPLVVQLAPRSAAYETGLEQGDVIVGIAGREIAAFDQLKEVIESSQGATAALTVWRAGEILDYELTPKRVDEPRDEGGFETNWRIGIAGGLAFELATERKGPLAATGDAVAQTWRVIEGSVSGLYHMITGAISSCNMSGPIGIAEVSGAMASQGLDSFIWFIAVLSTAVGLLNLFPIPVLDGGHLVFYAYEATTGRPPSDKALRVMMTAGLTLVLSVMVFALFNDIFCP